jgi:hypothetical protein
MRIVTVNKATGCHTDGVVQRGFKSHTGIGIAQTLVVIKVCRVKTAVEPNLAQVNFRMGQIVKQKAPDQVTCQSNQFVCGVCHVRQSF